MTYTVRPGDTLSKIAMRNGVSVAQLLQANPQITNPNRVSAGDVLNIPNSSTTTDTTKPLPASVATAAVGALGAAVAEALGRLSAKYETGGRGPGTVSTGSGDPGGVSYGSYQMATKMGTVTNFVNQPGFPWRADFQNLKAGTAQFTAVWKRIAQEQTAAFQEAQHAYIKKTHYDPLAEKILNETGLDVNTRSRALQDVVWSTAVQHGGATPIVCRACSSVSCDRSDPQYDELLIKAVYAERGKKKPDGNLAYFSKSSPGVQQGVSNRFRNECQDALSMLAKDV